MITIKKTYYALVLATATFAQLGADSYRDYFVPELRYNKPGGASNDAIFAQTLYTIVRDINKAYTLKDDNKYYLHDWLVEDKTSKVSSFFKDHNWVSEKLNNVKASSKDTRWFLSEKTLFEVFIRYIVIQTVDLAAKYGSEYVSANAPQIAIDAYNGFISYCPKPVRSIVSEVLKYAIKNVAIYGIESYIGAKLFSSKITLPQGPTVPNQQQQQ